MSVTTKHNNYCTCICYIARVDQNVHKMYIPNLIIFAFLLFKYAYLQYNEVTYL